MILERFTKQPAEVKDYDINYAEWLDPMADTLDAATTTVVCTTDPANTSLVVNTTEVANKSIKLWMSGGTDKQKYKVTVRVTTDGGRLDESELIFSVRDF
jgi:hypothetical protein